jgi:phosphate transport system substrate-binding protein
MITPMRSIALSLLVLLAACAPEAARPRDALAGVYKIGGGDASIGIVQALTDAFAAMHPGVKFDIDTSLGSDAAVKLAADTTLDLGMASRELTAEENTLVDRVIIGVAGTGLAVNAQNPVSSLSIAQLQALYSGKTTDWSAMGGEHGTVMPLIREKGSSARTTFENVVFGGKATLGSSVLEINGGDQMRQAIASYRLAIGIIGVSKDDPEAAGVRLLSLDGVAPTRAALLDGSYKLRRPLYLLVTHSATRKPAVTSFLDFVKSTDGQKILQRF